MPSKLKAVSYRPNDTETILLGKLADRRGLSASRLIGLAIREMAERDNTTATEAELAALRAKSKEEGAASE